MTEFDTEEFNVEEYNFFKNIVSYDNLNNYDGIPDILIELRKEKLNWSTLVISLLKENRLNKEFLLKYEDFLGESEWEYISEDYNFDNKECELFLFKINWERYLLINKNVLNFDYLASLNIFEKENYLLNYSEREDLFKQEINLDTLTTVLEKYDGENKKIIVGNFVCQCIVDEDFINNFFEYINFDYLFYYQQLSTDFINKNNNLFNIDDLLKYQYINYEDINYNNRGIFKYLINSPSNYIKNKELWINNDIYEKVNDLLLNKFNILVYNIEDKTGFYFDYNMKQDINQDDLSTISAIEYNEDEHFMSYGFLVLDKNVDLKNYLEYSNDLKVNDIIISNCYYNNYELDYEQFNRIPKVYIENENRIYNNIVSNANEFDLFYGIKLMNYEETLEFINNDQNKEKDLNIVMVSFNINNSVLFDIENIDLTCNKFTIIQTYDRDSFDENIFKDFKKYFINNYCISLEDSVSNEENLDLSIQEKVVSYLENTPDISFYSVEENFKKNPGYKNTTSSEMRIINNSNNVIENKPNFIWKIFGY